MVGRVPTANVRASFRRTEEGSEYVDDLESYAEYLAQFKGGLESGFDAFVMRPNVEAAPHRREELRDPANWDQKFLDLTVASIVADAANKNFYRRLEAIAPEYATVTSILQEEGLPEVFAAIPYHESGYRGSVVTQICAKG